MRRWLFLALAVAAWQGAAARADGVASDARIVFYRAYHIDADADKFRIRIGDADAGAVADGDGFVLHHAPGAVVFEIDERGTFGHLDFPMSLEAGKTYYVALAAKPGSNHSSAFGESMGETDVKPNAICESAWCAAAVAEPEAIADLKAIGFTPTP